MAEGVEPAVHQHLIEHGVAPLMGMSDCLDALGGVAGYQFERCSVASGSCVNLPLLQSVQLDDVVMQNEFESKNMLAKYGLKTPRRWAGAIADAPRTAAKIGFAVVLEILSDKITHKAEVGGVRLNLRDQDSVMGAITKTKGCTCTQRSRCGFPRSAH